MLKLTVTLLASIENHFSFFRLRSLVCVEGRDGERKGRNERINHFKRRAKGGGRDGEKGEETEDPV